ncbi:hypothetical protein ACQ3G6_09795, partial [Allorhizobium undicola]|uniref:hypothetical protein n=1 Tax=Allorhizobium undicola TaxID=78527 RepID=UPI003D358A6E
LAKNLPSNHIKPFSPLRRVLWGLNQIGALTPCFDVFSDAKPAFTFSENTLIANNKGAVCGAYSLRAPVV